MRVHIRERSRVLLLANTNEGGLHVHNTQKNSYRWDADFSISSCKVRRPFAPKVTSSLLIFLSSLTHLLGEALKQSDEHRVFEAVLGATGVAQLESLGSQVPPGLSSVSLSKGFAQVSLNAFPLATIEHSPGSRALPACDWWS